MKKNKNFYRFVLLIIFVFIIMFKIIVDIMPSDYIYIINAVFLLLMIILLYFKGGFPRDRSYYKKGSIKIVLIIMLFYILIIYLLGLFIGFVKNLYFYDIWMLLKAIIPIILFIITSEIARYLFLKHNPGKINIIIFTLELIILNIIMVISSYNVVSVKQLFVIVSMVIVPVITSEAMCTYITYNVSLIPTLLYKFIYNLLFYIVPFSPDLSEYFISVFGVVIPYIIYIEIKKYLSYKEKYGVYAKKKIGVVFSFIIFMFLGTLILLTSGIFKYQLIAIASGSMEPIYYRGDAVIVERVDVDTIEVGDILVYKASGGIITHRVIDMKEEEGEVVFYTKGDNSSTADSYKIKENNVKGIVRYIVKYAGYPTVLLNDFLESK